VEVHAHGVTLLGSASQESAARLDGESRLDLRYLDLRAESKVLIFEVGTTLLQAMREFLLRQEYIELHTPKITAGGSESGAAVFEVAYFDKKACLVQSPQFYMQLAMVAGFDRVFEVGPVFRAEPASTNRHAAEFTCIDVECSWIESCSELMDLEEALVRHALAVVRDRHGAEIRRQCGVDVEVPERAIPRIAFRDVRSLVPSASDSASRMSHGAEEAICAFARERFGHSFVFVTDYPAADRPFYTMRDQENTSRSFDLMWRGIEVTSGCQREHRVESLRRQVAELGLVSDTLSLYLDKHYLEMFRHGCPPHGGFGIGLERFLMAMLGQPSIRETSFVFRGPGRFVP
jgi:aspartyl-tRNA synthetase